MLKGDGAANNSRKCKRSYGNKNITPKRTLYAKYIKPSKHVEIEGIAKINKS